MQRNYGQPSNDGTTLAFTATGPEVNVFAPGVLNNDTVNLSTSGVTVPDWDEGHLSKVTAELTTPPRFAKEFHLNVDGSFRWVPIDGYNGADSFEYVAEYNGMCGAPGTVSISSTDLVYAQDDAYASNGGDAPMDQTLFGVLENDRNRSRWGKCHAPHSPHALRRVCPSTLHGSHFRPIRGPPGRTACRRSGTAKMLRRPRPRRQPCAPRDPTR